MNTLSNVLDYLNGKKTYISVIGIGICSILGQLGIVVPPLVLLGLKTFGAVGVTHMGQKFISALGDGGKVADTIAKAAGK